MTLKKLDLAWALDAEIPPLDFVLPGLVPGSVGLIVAPGATGKSTLALDIAVSVALGRDCAGGLFKATKPAKVVYLAAEESPAILAERLRRQLSLFERKCPRLEEHLTLFPMSGESCLLVSGGKTTTLFNDLAKACKGARLVVVDPLRRLHDSDENESSGMTNVVVALERLANMSGGAVIALHHANRSSQGDASTQHAARGSTALVDAARWQLNMSRAEPRSAEAQRKSVVEQAATVAVDFVKTNYIAPVARQLLRLGPDGRFALLSATQSPTRSSAASLGGARNL